MAKSIMIIKEALFTRLNDDTALRQLLGGEGRILHRQPPKDANYPCVIYDVISDVDNVFNEDRSTGEVTQSFFRVTIFSKSEKTEESDAIEAKIKELLHGDRTLDNDDVICYYCYRDNLLEPFRDPETLTWITSIRYKVTWGVK